MVGVSERANEVLNSPNIALQILGVLVVHGFHLPIHATLQEERTGEKARKDGKCLEKCGVVHIEVEVGVFPGRECVRRTVVPLEEFIIRVLLWMVLCSHKEKMLQHS